MNKALKAVDNVLGWNGTHRYLINADSAIWNMETFPDGSIRGGCIYGSMQYITPTWAFIKSCGGHWVIIECGPHGTSFTTDNMESHSSWNDFTENQHPVFDYASDRKIRLQIALKQI